MSRRINSKKKGAKNERDISKLLEKWTNKKFARTPSSGGLNWHARSSISGDIVCTTEGHYFPFSIEVKFHKEINFEHLLYIDNPEVMKFWAQAFSDAKKAGKIPLLFMRYNGLPKDFHFVAMDSPIFVKLVVENWGIIPFTNFLKVKHPKGNITIIKSVDLFKLSYKSLRKSAKQWLKKQK